MRPTVLVLTIAVLLAGLAVPSGASAQSVPRATTCARSAAMLNVTATVRPPRAVLEIDVELQNRSEDRVRIDPSRIALFSDRGEQSAPLSEDQVRQLIRHPALDLWAWFWIGSSSSEFGVGVGLSGVGSLPADLRSLPATDLLPGATLHGSVYFRTPHPGVDLFVLSFSGLTTGTSAVSASIDLICEVPKPAGATSGRARIVAPAARAVSGPVTAGVSAVSFSADATTLVLSVENSATVEANLFAAMADARLRDDRGGTYAVRMIRSDLPDRVPARGTVRGRLVFDPLPFPPLVRTVRLTLPGIRVGDALYEIALDLNF